MNYSTTINRLWREVGAEEAFSTLREIGYDGVDFSISLISKDPDGVFTESDTRISSFFAGIRQIAKKNGMKIFQTHAPTQIFPLPDGNYCEELAETVRKSIVATAALEAPVTVIHCLMPAGWDIDPDPNRTRELNLRFFEKLIPTAEQYRVTVALENMPFCFSPTGTSEKLCDYIDRMNSPWMAACLDTGHTHVVRSKYLPQMQNEPIGDFVRALGSRLRAVHLHDNSSRYDDHLCPGNGTVDWKAFFEALHTVSYSGPLSLESKFQADCPMPLYQEFESFQLRILKKLVNLYGFE